MGLFSALTKADPKSESNARNEANDVDILDTLKEEHEEVAALLSKLVQSTGASPSGNRSSRRSKLRSCRMSGPRRRWSTTRS